MILFVLFSFYILFSVSPQILHYPFNDTRSEKQSAKLTCDFHGYPLPSVTWMRDGKDLASSNRISISDNERLRFSVRQVSSVLTITNLVRGDQGLYTCTVNNTIRTVVSPSRTGFLTVNCKLIPCSSEDLSSFDSSNTALRNTQKDKQHATSLDEKWQLNRTRCRVLSSPDYHLDINYYVSFELSISSLADPVLVH